MWSSPRALALMARQSPLQNFTAQGLRGRARGRAAAAHRKFCMASGFKYAAQDGAVAASVRRHKPVCILYFYPTWSCGLWEGWLAGTARPFHNVNTFRASGVRIRATAEEAQLWGSPPWRGRRKRRLPRRVPAASHLRDPPETDTRPQPNLQLSV